MNTDFRVAVDFFAHHKARKLKKRLGSDGLMALLQLWAYAAKLRADGDLSGMSVEDIELASGWDGTDGALVSALVEVGFLDQNGEAYALHDWLENNSWAAGADARSDASRFSRMARTYPNEYATLVEAGVKGISKEDYESLRSVNERQTTVERLLNELPSPAPAPSPAPVPSPSDKESSLREDAGTKVPPCPHQQILDMYHELLPVLPRMKVWDKARKGNLGARWRERWEAKAFSSQAEGLDYFRRMFEYVGRECDFLMGRVTDRDGKPFFASLDWIAMPRNFAKIIEGKYTRREAA